MFCHSALMDTLAILRHNGETKLGHQIAGSGVQVSLRKEQSGVWGFLPVRCGRWTGRFVLYSKSRKMGQFCGLKRRSDAHLMKESLSPLLRSKSSKRNKRSAEREMFSALSINSTFCIKLERRMLRELLLQKPTLDQCKERAILRK